MWPRGSAICLVAALVLPLRIASAATWTDEMALHGNAQLLEDAAGAQLRLQEDGYAEWTPPLAPVSDAGTFSFWIKPLWPDGDHESHTFATFRWSGADSSYFALSQGWWEPTGQGKLYLVFNNQRYAFCLQPWEYPYRFFAPDQWTHLAVTWHAGDPGYVRLTVDGKGLCERKIALPAGSRLQGPVYLGSDRGAGAMSRDRPARMMIKGWQLAPTATSPLNLWESYRGAGGSDRRKWMLAATPTGELHGSRDERRVLYDEDTHWADSRSEIRRRIGRLKAAGFNVYVPCVWDGTYAFFSSRVAPVKPRLGDPVDKHYDPLAFLIREAHSQGIEVHPWFVVTRHPSGTAGPESFLAGAPAEAFNIHTAAFRDFIVSLIVDAAQSFELDGVNLDYIRAIGPCSDPACVQDYLRRYGRNLLQDWSLAENGQNVASLIAFNREATTDIVRRVSVALRRLRPGAVISIDSVPFDHSRQHQGVDEQGWLEAHLIDDLVDMSYDDPIDLARLDHAMQTFGAARQVVLVANYDLFADDVVDRSGRTMSDYIQLIRGRWPGAGAGFYHYPHLEWDQITTLRQGVFASEAKPAWVH